MDKHTPATDLHELVTALHPNKHGTALMTATAYAVAKPDWIYGGDRETQWCFGVLAICGPGTDAHKVANRVRTHLDTELTNLPNRFGFVSRRRMTKLEPLSRFVADSPALKTEDVFWVYVLNSMKDIEFADRVMSALTPEVLALLVELDPADVDLALNQLADLEQGRRDRIAQVEADHLAAQQAKHEQHLDQVREQVRARYEASSNSDTA